MRPSRYDRDDYGVLDTLCLAALAFAFGVALLIVESGRGIGWSWRALVRNARTFGGLVLGCLVGIVIGVPLWWWCFAWAEAIAR